MNHIKTRVYIANTLSLENPELLERYLNEASPERQEKVSRMRSIKARALSLGAEVLMKEALFKSFGIQKNPVIKKGVQGKPCLSDYPGIHFNLSHSGNYAVCALGIEPVGVDIQKMDRFNLDLARRYFADEEVTWLLDLPAEKQKKGFFDLWAIKESYMKYTSKGFNLAMKNFSARIQGEFPEKVWGDIFEGEKKADVFLKKYSCPEEYTLWCCSGTSNFEEALEWISLEGEV